MGLLDQFGDFIKTPEGIGLLSGLAGYAANAQRGTPINNLGRGAMTGIMGYSNAQDQINQNKQAEQMGQLRTMQIDQMTRQQLLNKRLGEALQNGSSGQSNVPAAMADGNGPTVANANILGGLNASQPQITSPARHLLRAAQEAGDFDAYQKAQAMLLEEKKLSPKYSTDVRMVRINGVPTPVQMADDGSWKPMGENVSHAEKLSFQNIGGTTEGLDPYTGKSAVSMGHTMTPGEQASNNLGLANFKLSSSNATKPTFNSDAGGWVYPPTAQNPTGQVVAPSGMVPKPLNGEQGKASGFVKRMIEAEKIISEPNSKESPTYIESVAGSIPFAGEYFANSARSPQRQVTHQAQKEWVRAKLRKESGAVIGKDEEEAEIRTYFPVQGDSPEVIAQKAQARRVAMEAISGEAGPNAKVPTIKPKSKQFKLDDGKAVIGNLGEDGNYYVTKGNKKFRIEE